MVGARFIAAWSAIATLGFVAPAAACPNCTTGRQARTLVCNDHLGFNLAATLLPFVLVGGICRCIEAVGRPPKTAARRRTAGSPVARSASGKSSATRGEA